jgi:hypothetical protein
LRWNVIGTIARPTCSNRPDIAPSPLGTATICGCRCVPVNDFSLYDPDARHRRLFGAVPQRYLDVALAARSPVTSPRADCRRTVDLHALK